MTESLSDACGSITGCDQMMLILFCLVLLFIFLLIFFAAAAPAKSRQSRVRIERTRSTPRIDPPRDEPLFRPGPMKSPEQGASLSADLFAPMRSESVASSPPPRVAEVMNVTSPTPSFTGRSQINWNARCRLTGEPCRICSCQECKAMRDAHGLH